MVRKKSDDIVFVNIANISCMLIIVGEVGLWYFKDFEKYDSLLLICSVFSCLFNIYISHVCSGLMVVCIIQSFTGTVIWKRNTRELWRPVNRK